MKEEPGKEPEAARGWGRERLLFQGQLQRIWGAVTKLLCPRGSRWWCGPSLFTDGDTECQARATLPSGQTSTSSCSVEGRAPPSTLQILLLPLEQGIASSPEPIPSCLWVILQDLSFLLMSNGAASPAINVFVPTSVQPLHCLLPAQGCVESTLSRRSGALPLESLWWVMGSQGNSLVQGDMAVHPQGLT